MKIAHISDFHLRHHLEGDNIKCGPDLIAEGARHIAVHSPDLVVVTGDLVDYPLDALDDPDTVCWGKKISISCANVLIVSPVLLRMCMAITIIPRLFAAFFPISSLILMCRVFA